MCVRLRPDTGFDVPSLGTKAVQGTSHCRITSHMSSDSTGTDSFSQSSSSVPDGMSIN